MTEKKLKSPLLSQVAKPGRYLGREHNAIVKKWHAGMTRWVVAFPDLYEIGMSHQGLQILYHLLNSSENCVAERVFCPDLDLEKQLRQNSLVLTSLESDRPLADFDILGITLPYELCYTNILTILDLGRIPLRAADRTDDHPLVIGGGSCAMNPEPVADFFDAILLGDGEEAVLDIDRVLAAARLKNMDRSSLLAQLVGIEGVYVPSFFTPQYDEAGRLTKIDDSHEHQVKRRVLPDLDDCEHLFSPIVPNSKIVHDRLGIEIARGCTRGCRFCQAGMIYRPVRERSPQQIMELAGKGLTSSGFDELALLSLSTGDYSCFEQVLPALMDSYSNDYVSVSMPSMRVGTLSEEVMDQIKRVRKTGFTLAPEAGSERLRRVINKGISEQDLLETVESAAALGWKLIKLYFMIGLPTECDKDIEAIVELAKKVHKKGGGRLRLNVSIGTFVPKPHTPFQWAEQISMDQSTEKINQLKRMLPRKNINLKWHDPEQSFLEGVFSRGDRRLGSVIEQAWKMGSRLDGWSDHFQLSIWQEAADQCDVILEDYLRQRREDEILPWHHLASGVDEDFLRLELKRAKKEAYTPDCRYHSCQKCGLCDFKTIKPVVIDRKRFQADRTDEPPRQPPPSPSRPVVQGDDHFRYMVSYSRLGQIALLGHLEFLQLTFRVLRRAGIQTHFSKGFNPSPKVSFGPALSVGTESHDEYFIMDLPAPLSDIPAAIDRLNEELPRGITIKNIEIHPGKIPQRIRTRYSVTCPQPITNQEKQRLDEFIQSAEFPISRTRKGKTKNFDIRPLVHDMLVDGEDIIRLELISQSGAPGVKPMEVVASVLQLDPELTARCQVVKDWWREDHS
ncbi:MAG: TIGR03960 family B12-binding radical SAM protein [Thermodesulfobacteriota bacterium]